MASHVTRTRGRAIALVMLSASSVLAIPLMAQQPEQQPASPALAPYRPPAIALVAPAPGVAIPQDKPVVVFRFVPGDSTDPLDLTSLAISVDGENRTALFHATPSDAWGPIAGEPTAMPPISVGTHQVSARICSDRGVCGETTAQITVAAPIASAAIAPTAASTKHHGLLGKIGAVLKKIITP